MYPTWKNLVIRNFVFFDIINTINSNIYIYKLYSGLFFKKLSKKWKLFPPSAVNENLSMPNSPLYPLLFKNSNPDSVKFEE